MPLEDQISRLYDMLAANTAALDANTAALKAQAGSKPTKTPPIPPTPKAPVNDTLVQAANPPVAPPPSGAPAVTLNDLVKPFSLFVGSNFDGAVALLKKFGVAKLSLLPADKLQEFAAEFTKVNK